MSFAQEVKKELKEHVGKASHCQKAELFGIYEGCLKNIPKDIDSEKKKKYLIFSESLTISEKCISLVKKAWHSDAFIEKYNGHSVVVTDSKIKKDLTDGEVLIKKDCCKRAYLRGMFLAAGTVTNPSGRYNLEIVVSNEDLALKISEIMGEYGSTPGLRRRKDTLVVYLREGQSIVDFLGLIGAYNALMKFENERIVKEVRANVNRTVNCETSNIKKSISASARQIEDIEFIRDNYGLDRLPKGLFEIAELRLKYPLSSLTELGHLLGEPIGKSGVNHRLRKLSAFAKELRDERKKK